MNDSPRQKLCEPVAKYGEPLCDEPLKCEGLLRDLCGQYRLEVNLLIDAIKERITTDLRNSSDALPLDVTLARLTKRTRQHVAARLDLPDTASQCKSPAGNCRTQDGNRRDLWCGKINRALIGSFAAPDE